MQEKTCGYCHFHLTSRKFLNRLARCQVPTSRLKSIHHLPKQLRRLRRRLLHLPNNPSPERLPPRILNRLMKAGCQPLQGG